MKSPPHRSPVVLAVVLAAIVTAPAASQDASAAAGGGMWWEVSAAAGGARLTCTICDTSRDLAPSLGAALGAYARPGLRVGVEGGAISNSDGDVREEVYHAGLVAHLHPRPGSGLHVLGGLGWSGYRAEDFTYDAARLTLGVGWDLPLTGSWVAGNRLTVDASSYGSLRNAGVRVARPVGLSVVRFGVYVRKR